MTSCSAKENVSPTFRRARPWLGTLVEISIGGADEPMLAAGVERAFTSVEKVHQTMSYYEVQSDVGQLNRMAHRESVEVSPWTYEVLAAGLELAEASEGVFDFTVAAELVEWGYLPASENGDATERSSTWRDVALLPGHRVRFRRPLCLDLGGIAKGFAVDCAVAALQTAGISYGCVNAGGDLRAFGDWSCPVQIRHPLAPGQMAGEFALCGRAAATSALYFSRKRHGSNEVSPLLDGATRKPCIEDVSATVIADTAQTADALTKVVMARGREAAPLLARYGASALLLVGNAAPVFIGDQP